MIAKKVCLLGSFAVGKTSLVRRYVDSLFSEKYLTTIGVKIDKKVVSCAGQDIQLMIWDIEGRDDFSEFRSSYLRGASGYFLVLDATRPDSLAVATEIYEHIQMTMGNLPLVALLNKIDLVNEKRLDINEINELQHHHWDVITTSAKTGENVNEAFQLLTQKMLSQG
ncbi:MAG: GTP-binding protein [Hahellaceae bacterium]|nr:GTP-binding protein [Hahellaceae bacterium]